MISYFKLVPYPDFGVGMQIFFLILPLQADSLLLQYIATLIEQELTRFGTYLILMGTEISVNAYSTQSLLSPKF
jgi:hypothetical protein